MSMSLARKMKLRLPVGENGETPLLDLGRHPDDGTVIVNAIESPSGAETSATAECIKHGDRLVGVYIGFGALTFEQTRQVVEQALALRGTFDVRREPDWSAQLQSIARVRVGADQASSGLASREMSPTLGFDDDVQVHAAPFLTAALSLDKTRDDGYCTTQPSGVEDTSSSSSVSNADHLQQRHRRTHSRHTVSIDLQKSAQPTNPLATASVSLSAYSPAPSSVSSTNAPPQAQPQPQVQVQVGVAINKKKRAKKHSKNAVQGAAVAQEDDTESSKSEKKAGKFKFRWHSASRQKAPKASSTGNATEHYDKLASFVSYAEFHNGWRAIDTHMCSYFLHAADEPRAALIVSVNNHVPQLAAGPRPVNVQYALADDAFYNSVADPRERGVRTRGRGRRARVKHPEFDLADDFSLVVPLSRFKLPSKSVSMPATLREAVVAPRPAPSQFEYLGACCVQHVAVVQDSCLCAWQLAAGQPLSERCTGWLSLPAVQLAAEPTSQWCSLAPRMQQVLAAPAPLPRTRKLTVPLQHDSKQPPALHNVHQRLVVAVQVETTCQWKSLDALQFPPDDSLALSQQPDVHGLQVQHQAPVDEHQLLKQTTLGRLHHAKSHHSSSSESDKLQMQMQMQLGVDQFALAVTDPRLDRRAKARRLQNDAYPESDLADQFSLVVPLKFGSKARARQPATADATDKRHAPPVLHSVRPRTSELVQQEQGVLALPAAESREPVEPGFHTVQVHEVVHKRTASSLMLQANVDLGTPDAHQEMHVQTSKQASLSDASISIQSEAQVPLEHASLHAVLVESPIVAAHFDSRAEWETRVQDEKLHCFITYELFAAQFDLRHAQLSSSCELEAVALHNALSVIDNLPDANSASSSSSDMHSKSNSNRQKQKTVEFKPTRNVEHDQFYAAVADPRTKPARKTRPRRNAPLAYPEPDLADEYSLVAPLAALAKPRVSLQKSRLVVSVTHPKPITPTLAPPLAAPLQDQSVIVISSSESDDDAQNARTKLSLTPVTLHTELLVPVATGRPPAASKKERAKGRKTKRLKTSQDSTFTYAVEKAKVALDLSTSSQTRFDRNVAPAPTDQHSKNKTTVERVRVDVERETAIEERPGTMPSAVVHVQEPVVKVKGRRRGAVHAARVDAHVSDDASEIAVDLGAYTIESKAAGTEAFEPAEAHVTVELDETVRKVEGRRRAVAFASAAASASARVDLPKNGNENASGKLSVEAHVRLGADPPETDPQEQEEVIKDRRRTRYVASSKPAQSESESQTRSIDSSKAHGGHRAHEDSVSSFVQFATQTNVDDAELHEEKDKFDDTLPTRKISAVSALRRTASNASIDDVPDFRPRLQRIGSFVVSPFPKQSYWLARCDRAVMCADEDFEKSTRDFDTISVNSALINSLLLDDSSDPE